MNHSGSRNTRISLAITIGLALVVPLVCPRPVTADTVTNTLISGIGSIGSQDPATQFSLDSGSTWQNAYIIPPNGNYNTITGSQWVSVSPYGNGPENTTMLYQVTFTLPTGATNPSFAMQLFADDQASLYLNGTFLGQQTNSPGPGHPYPNFTFPASVFTAYDPAVFVTGLNNLEFVVYNGNDPTGLDYDGLLTFSIPEPSTILLATLGSVSLLARFKRKRT